MCRESLYSTSKTGLLVFVDAKVNKLLDVLTFLMSIKARRVFFCLFGMGSMPKVVELFEQRCLCSVYYWL